MIEFLLLDLDDTILDFLKSEDYGIRKTLKRAGIEPTDAVCARYSQINKGFWKQLELGEVTRDQLNVGRFRQLFEELEVVADAAAAAEDYMENLSSVHFFLPGAEEAVKRLQKTHRLFIVSNGTASTQQRRLANAKLYPYFEQVFISELVGVNKPDKLFFDRCFAQIPGFDPEKAMIVGDSLSSDIKGGKNAGIRTCWVNPKHKTAPEEIRPDYEIEALSQLEALLETL